MLKILVEENTTAWVGFEPAPYSVAAQHVSHQDSPILNKLEEFVCQ